MVAPEARTLVEAPSSTGTIGSAIRALIDVVAFGISVRFVAFGTRSTGSHTWACGDTATQKVAAAVFIGTSVLSTNVGVGAQVETFPNHPARVNTPRQELISTTYWFEGH